jgi:undecaprenyl-diphosphatase
MANYWTAVILGIVEGLTEFLPVSSTGHLILAGHLLKFTGKVADTFEVFIQLGAILAVVFLYRRRFRGLLPGRGWADPLRIGKRFVGIRGCILLGLTTFPALIAGRFAYGFIKGHLFNPYSVALGLAVGGLGLLLVERWRPPVSAQSLDKIRWRQALLVGLFQCLSMWPGVSRAGATIIGGLVSGLDRKTAAEYSFLAAVPVMMAATGYDLLKTRHYLQVGDWLFLGIGFAVSFLVAYITVAAFIRLLQRLTLTPFAWYRIALAPIILNFWPNS